MSEKIYTKKEVDLVIKDLTKRFARFVKDHDNTVSDLETEIKELNKRIIKLEQQNG